MGGGGSVGRVAGGAIGCASPMNVGLKSRSALNLFRNCLIIDSAKLSKSSSPVLGGTAVVGYS